MTNGKKYATLTSVQGIGFTLSNHEEIMAVYESDIAEKTRLVESKFGKKPFYDNFRGFHIEKLYGGLGIHRIVCSEYTPGGDDAA